MVAGIFHQGSGIGNQLHRYVMTRVLALDGGFDFGMVHPQNFKASSFMRLDMGQDPLTMKGPRFYVERRVNNDIGEDVRGYDFEGIDSVKDNTVIDGEFQGEKYYWHRMREIDQWLRVEPMEFDANTCIIQFRGGEYQLFPRLFLTAEYWRNAVANMLRINPSMTFEVHTDDSLLASMFFPDYLVVHNPEINWRAIRHAPYLILSNSSFSILPALLNDKSIVIAPKYWARHNVSDGWWAMGQNRCSAWLYQDREGKLDYEQ